ncbi:bifunctional 2-polyprenyl-6-hydroxyphenol methylase/3-demethylubiquinol 3-O-methyltransferase UbiG [Methylosinus sp. RM1]|uniref:class I SAM-dependent methyltransferase n=1 Tax=Methylosinus sp. RM1 TaxID=2583817 RepID=UPI0014074350|nr:class I SAM-dependent methyltransferase [Methylosinus sp. RM1]
MIGRDWFRPRPRSEEAPVTDLFSGDETRAPSFQNAVDAIPGWSCHFPVEYGLSAGKLPTFDDPRITWAMERFGDLSGRAVLELGPLEASHTYMLAKAGAHVDAVEANRLAFLKCLVAREILDFPNARFYLGDFVQWLEQTETRYDLIVASGVLYHMRDPLRLLRAMSERADAIYLWTVIVDDDRLAPSATQRFEGLDMRLYARGYGDRSVAFCGGSMDFPNWMHRNDVLAALRALGYEEITVLDDIIGTAGNTLPTFSVFARRRPAEV